MSNMYKVEKPIYQDYKDIQKQYDENIVVITNAVWEESPLSFVGGIVRYYGDDKKSLINKWGEFINSDKEDEYGKCFFTNLMRDRGVRFYYG